MNFRRAPIVAVIAHATRGATFLPMAGVRSLVATEFSEDEFQALAFAELAHRFRGVAVGGPFIADRRAERRHGVDAWIRIRQGGRLRALFLQYKVPKLVISRTLDASASAVYGGNPYFRFALHKDEDDRKRGAPDVHRQHNNLVLLRSLTRNPAYYCAPTFLEWGQLLKAFYRGEIYEGCLLGDPSAIGRISGRGTHHVTYATDFSAWAFHSKPKPLGRPTTWADALADTEGREWTADTLDDLADTIERVVAGDEHVDEGKSNQPDPARPNADGVRSVLRLAVAAERAYGGPVLLVPEAGQSGADGN